MDAVRNEVKRRSRNPNRLVLIVDLLTENEDVGENLPKNERCIVCS